MEIKNTNDVKASKIKMLVYGVAGAGKTSLIPTMPKPIVLSAEGGLLSIAGTNTPYVEIKSVQDMKEAYKLLTSPEADKFESVALDSISEIAEVVLSHEKANNKDPRKAYGEMQDIITKMIRAFRDLDKHVLMTAKVEKSMDEMGRILYAPSMPGQKMGQLLPYFFDEILALRVEKDTEGNTVRTLQCDGDGIWQAKDRSRWLTQWEKPDLGEIIDKINRRQADD